MHKSFKIVLILLLSIFVKTNFAANNTVEYLYDLDGNRTTLTQEEVLLNEGYFKQIGQPKKILNTDGTPKKDIDGTEWYEVQLEELGTPIRNIN